MMVFADPMPDEVAAGQMGRLRWLNEWPDRLLATQSLQRALAVDGVDTEGVNAFYLLAAASNMAAIDYARLHTVLPATRLVSDFTAGVPHGEPHRGCAAPDYGLYLPRGLPLVCPNCIGEDMGHWGVSWYRRSHQMVGVDWCEKHGCELARVHSRDPFWLTPYWQLEGGHLMSIDAHRAHLGEVPEFVRRFVAISSATLPLSAPARSSMVNRRLADRAHAMGLDCDRSSARSLSHWIVECAPEPWLRAHFPDLLDRQSYGAEMPVDKLLRRHNFVPEGHHYVLAMTALFEDADVALRSLFGLSARLCVTTA